jgi:hypothetical protein
MQRKPCPYSKEVVVLSDETETEPEREIEPEAEDDLGVGETGTEQRKLAVVGELDGGAQW